MSAVKFLVAALFFAVAFCTLFTPPGPLNSAAWVAAAPVDLLVIGYYVHRKYARKRDAGTTTA